MGIEKRCGTVTIGEGLRVRYMLRISETNSKGLKLGEKPKVTDANS